MGFATVLPWLRFNFASATSRSRSSPMRLCAAHDAFAHRNLRRTMLTACMTEHRIEDGCTLDGAAQRLKELIDSSKDACAMRDQLIGTRLAWNLNRVCVRTSLINGAGNGLFAARQLDRGELITFYPGDLRVRWQRSNLSLAEGVGFVFGAHVPTARRDLIRHALLEAGPEELDVIPVIGGDTGTSVAGDPMVTDDPAYVAHVINDCATCSTLDGIAEYAAAAITRANAHTISIEGCHLAAVAAKRVEKGEEIYMSYGPPYWLGRMGATAEELDAVAIQWAGLSLR